MLYIQESDAVVTVDGLYEPQEQEDTAEKVFYLLFHLVFIAGIQEVKLADDFWALSAGKPISKRRLPEEVSQVASLSLSSHFLVLRNCFTLRCNISSEKSAISRIPIWPTSKL